MRIRLTPFDYDFLRVHWKIGGNNHYFYPSCVMGSQFSAFLTAVFLLYEEQDITHSYGPKKTRNFSHEYPFERQDNKHLKQSKVFWDEEGFCHFITFTRHCEDDRVCPAEMPDPINITIKSGRRTYEYIVDGRDLCYAIAKGYTEAIKKYGLTGYRESSGMQYPGDSFDLHEFLFIKAYALNALAVRERKDYESWKNLNCTSPSGRIFGSIRR